MGLLRLGNLVRYVPVSLVIGFTNGIAVLIALSQLRDLLGCGGPGCQPTSSSQIRTIYRHIDTLNPWSLLLWARCACSGCSSGRASGTAVGFPPAARSHRGSQCAARDLAAAGADRRARDADRSAALGLPVETIGSRFGGIPQGLPLPSSCPTSAGPASAAGDADAGPSPRWRDRIAAVRACGQINGPGAKHDPNQELMAQGVAMVVSLLRRHAVTGTIARTVTNIRAAACRWPGMMHAADLRWSCCWHACSLHVPLWRCSPASCCSWPGTWASGASSRAATVQPALPADAGLDLPGHGRVRLTLAVELG